MLAQWVVFGRIAAVFVLPLSLLFLLHIAIYHALFSQIDHVDSVLDDAVPDTASQRRLLSRFTGDWPALLFSLLSTAAAVFSVASVYSAKHDARIHRPHLAGVSPFHSCPGCCGGAAGVMRLSGCTAACRKPPWPPSESPPAKLVAPSLSHRLPPLSLPDPLSTLISFLVPNDRGQWRWKSDGVEAVAGERWR